MIEKVIFDMDGLIFDTERLFMREQMRVVSEYGYTLTEEMYASTLGLTGAALTSQLKALFGEEYPEKEVTRRVRERLERTASEGGLPVKRGIRELLVFLADMDIACAVASSTHTNYVRRYLEAAELDGYFGAVIGGETVARSKPAPDIFIKALGETPRSGALILEDSENGVRAAAAAEIPVICIPDIAVPSEDVLRLAERTVRSADEVIEIVREKNGGKY